MINELLPIGSIVLLKGGIRKLMITGIKTVVKEEPDTIYDYIGVLYPEGFIGDEGTVGVGFEISGRSFNISRGELRGISFFTVI